jgi:hypothetical protein
METGCVKIWTGLNWLRIISVTLIWVALNFQVLLQRVVSYVVMCTSVNPFSATDLYRSTAVAMSPVLCTAIEAFDTQTCLLHEYTAQMNQDYWSNITCHVWEIIEPFSGPVTLLCLVGRIFFVSEKDTLEGRKSVQHAWLNDIFHLWFWFPSIGRTLLGTVLYTLLMRKWARISTNAGIIKWDCVWTHVLRNTTLSKNIWMNSNFVNSVYRIK